MAKQGKVPRNKRKRLTEAQKRRNRVVKAIGRWNAKREKGSRLDRKGFWATYREVTAQYANTTEAVKAVRQGRFALSGKSVKGKAGAKGKAPKRPVRSRGNAPSTLRDVICWWDLETSLRQSDNESVLTRRGVVDWGKLGGFFEDDDLIILKFSDYGPNVPDYAFEWKDVTGIVTKLQGDTALAQAVSQYTSKGGQTSLSKIGSPQACFALNEDETLFSEGVFFFDLDAEAGSKGGAGGGARFEEDVPIPQSKIEEQVDAMTEEEVREMMSRMGYDVSKKKEDKKPAKKSTKRKGKKKK